MKTRHGSTNRIWDGKRFTIVVGGSYISDGSHRRPTVRVIDRKLNADGKMRGKRGHRSVTIPLPLVRYRRCYRLRHVGGLAVYRAYSRAMRAVCSAPRKASA